MITLVTIAGLGIIVAAATVAAYLGGDPSHFGSTNIGE